MTKIAFATDDGHSISRHYGRARSFMVVTVEDGRERFRELRDKANHDSFAAARDAGEPSCSDEPAAGVRRHDAMIDSCWDCEVVVVAGIGDGAMVNLAASGLQAIVTDRVDIDEALADWLAGRLQHHPERVHRPSGMGPGRHTANRVGRRGAGREPESPFAPPVHP
jgi:predicted Fe-Mo cluster-binding NifX family protein